MSGDDSELERLKARRLAEMQKNISSREQPAPPAEPERRQQEPRDVVVSRLGYRGLEVLQNAESQFPDQTRMILAKLSELILAGELTEELDGGNLMVLFRSVGLHVRIDTTIKVEKDGKMVSLSDKLRSESGGGRD